MAFCRTIIHVVQPGDTFYRLAQRYQTTVPEIILRNPGVNPYNLQVGTRLSICNGQDQNTVQRDEMDLNNDMRKFWQQNNVWGRMFMTSLYNALGDLDAVQTRLMQTPEDISSVFDKFYPQATVNQLTGLLSEYTRLAGEVMRAMQAPEMAGMEAAERQWMQTAERLARLLSSINTEYSYDEILKALNSHMDFMRRQMTAALGQEFDEEIRLFDESENQILQFADYLTNGLLEQFYRS